MRWLMLLCVASCGRIDFEPLHADGDAQPVLVQAKSALNSGLVVMLPVEPTRAGSLLVMMVTGIGSPVPVASIDDDAGNVYVSANAQSYVMALGGTAEIWYATAAKPGASAVSITSQVQALRGMWFLEVEPDLAFDQVAVLSNAAQGATAAGPEVTPSSTPAMVASLAVVSGTTTGLGSPSPFVALEQQNGDQAGYALASAPGPYQAVWLTNPGGTYCGSTVSFTAR